MTRPRDFEFGDRSVGNHAASVDQPVSELVKQLSEQLPRLAREEMQLARAELAEKGKRAGLGGGLVAGAAVVAWFGAGALVAAAIVALSLVVALWLAAVIAGAALLLVAGVAALLGRRLVGRATPPVPRQAVESVKSDVEQIRERAQR